MDITRSKSSRTRGRKKINRIDSKETCSIGELKARHDRLTEEITELDRQINELKSKGVTTNLKPQMDVLHQYNDMKDLTQIVLGYIADAEHVTVGELHRRFGLPMD